MTGSTMDALAIVLRGYEEGWNRGHLEVLEELLAPDFRAYDPSAPSGVVGLSEVRELLSQIRTAFPDIRREALDHVAQNDKIAVRWRVTGPIRAPLGVLLLRVAVSTSPEPPFTGLSKDKLPRNGFRWTMPA